jgi:mannose-6-phosphate isomerase
MPAATNATAYPLVLAPILMSKVWGGERLRHFGKEIAQGATIGESWELADLDATSASGGGGAAAQSVIANGLLAGRTLRQAMQQWGSAGWGRLHPHAGGAFPMLVKFLDAKENLSVQVHPSAAYAKAHPGAHLKTECWFILDAQPGSMIYKGVKSGVTQQAFDAALRQGDGAGVVDLMQAIPAVAGACHTLPSGTVHALGAGVLVAEVQTPSDTTFRVYDWGRTGRELHIDQSMECIAFEPADQARALPQRGMGVLSDTEYFRLEGEQVSAGAECCGSCDGALPRVIMAVGTAAELRWNGGIVQVPLGATALIPASLVNSTRVRAVEGGIVLSTQPKPA